MTPRWAPYVFISPFLLLFAVFGVFPLCFSLWLAFQSWEPTSGLGAMQFVGLENFSFALGDAWFWKSLKNTAVLALASGVPQHLVAIPLAVFIHGRFKRLRNAVVGTGAILGLNSAPVLLTPCNAETPVTTIRAPAGASALAGGCADRPPLQSTTRDTRARCGAARRALPTQTRACGARCRTSRRRRGVGCCPRPTRAVSP